MTTLGELLVKQKAIRWAELQQLAGRRLIRQAIKSTAARARVQVTCDTCTSEKGCCRVAVLVGLWEAVPVAAMLRADGRDTPTLRSNLLAIGGQIDADHLTGDGTQTFHRYQACAFLVGERCSIYSVRPAACSGYAVASPAENCRGPATRPVAQLDTRKESAFTMTALNTPFCRLLGLAATTPYITALPRAIALLLGAWDRHDYVDFLSGQAWLSLDDLDAVSDKLAAWAAENRHHSPQSLVQLKMPRLGEGR